MANNNCRWQWAAELYAGDPLSLTERMDGFTTLTTLRQAVETARVSASRQWGRLDAPPVGVSVRTLRQGLARTDGDTAGIAHPAPSSAYGPGVVRLYIHRIAGTVGNSNPHKQEHKMAYRRNRSPNGTQMGVVHARVPARTAESLRAQAQAQDVTVSCVIARAIAAYLAQVDVPQPRR